MSSAALRAAIVLAFLNDFVIFTAEMLYLRRVEGSGPSSSLRVFSGMTSNGGGQSERGAIGINVKQSWGDTRDEQKVGEHVHRLPMFKDSEDIGFVVPNVLLQEDSSPSDMKVVCFGTLTLWLINKRFCFFSGICVVILKSNIRCALGYCLRFKKRCSKAGMINYLVLRPSVWNSETFQESSLSRPCWPQTLSETATQRLHVHLWPQLRTFLLQQNESKMETLISYTAGQYNMHFYLN